VFVGFVVWFDMYLVGWVVCGVISFVFVSGAGVF